MILNGASLVTKTVGLNLLPNSPYNCGRQHNLLSNLSKFKAGARYPTPPLASNGCSSNFFRCSDGARESLVVNKAGSVKKSTGLQLSTF